MHDRATQWALGQPVKLLARCRRPALSQLNWPSSPIRSDRFLKCRSWVPTAYLYSTITVGDNNHVDLTCAGTSGGCCQSSGWAIERLTRRRVGATILMCATQIAAMRHRWEGSVAGYKQQQPGGRPDTQRREQIDAQCLQSQEDLLSSASTWPIAKLADRPRIGKASSTGLEAGEHDQVQPYSDHGFEMGVRRPLSWPQQQPGHRRRVTQIAPRTCPSACTNAQPCASCPPSPINSCHFNVGESGTSGSADTRKRISMAQLHPARVNAPWEI